MYSTHANTCVQAEDCPQNDQMLAEVTTGGSVRDWELGRIMLRCITTFFEDLFVLLFFFLNFL